MSHYKTIALAVATFALTSALPSIASAQQASSFQKSCTNVRYAQQGGQAMIVADCRRKNGSMMSSSVAIRGIDNTEGDLTHTAGPRNPSTFQRSCRNMSIRMGGPSGVQLAGSCRTSQGKYLNATTEIWDIVNNDGKLQYTY